MKVFVTGATGFAGSAIVQEPINSGHQVIGLSRNEASDKTRAAIGAQAHRGDLNDLDSLLNGAATDLSYILRLWVSMRQAENPGSPCMASTAVGVNSRPRW